MLKELSFLSASARSDISSNSFNALLIFNFRSSNGGRCWEEGGGSGEKENLATANTVRKMKGKEDCVRVGWKRETRPSVQLVEKEWWERYAREGRNLD